MALSMYLLGRSNVGKSTIGQVLSDRGVVVHKDLDALLRSRHPSASPIMVAQDWQIVHQLLEELDAQDHEPRILVSIGAGKQDGDRNRNDRNLELWLSERSDRVILIDGAKDVIRARFKGPIQNFDPLEYGPDRERLHQIAGQLIDIRGLTPDMAAHRLQSLIDGMV